MERLLYLIEILHQTTTHRLSCNGRKPLYLIEILHQTTTPVVIERIVAPLYLIEILHQTTTQRANNLFLRQLYLIEILHQTTTIGVAGSIAGALYLIEILHQTTTWIRSYSAIQSCILLKFYIKPQRHADHHFAQGVVSYWNSTSNHNYLGFAPILLYVVSYWNSTSNHNTGEFIVIAVTLYLIEILHQTTTSLLIGNPGPLLYLIEILHQTTTGNHSSFAVVCCILLKFYIKPQR